MKEETLQPFRVANIPGSTFMELNRLVGTLLLNQRDYGVFYLRIFFRDQPCCPYLCSTSDSVGGNYLHLDSYYLSMVVPRYL